MPAPWEKYGKNPAALYSAPAPPSKPSSGFAPAGAPVQQQYIPGSEADPVYIARKAELEARANAAAQASKDIRVKTATAPIDLSNDLAKARYEAELKTDPNNIPKFTPEVRKEAINAYNSAKQLQAFLDDAMAKFDAGPGKTSGISGLRDYLPYTANQQFDTAGGRMRGNVASAMGFTASQNNTEKESQRNVGSFIPESADRDAVVKDKFKSIQELIDNARERAIQQLGGVPDASGNIISIEEAQKRGMFHFNPPDGGGDPPQYLGGGPQQGLATGATRNVSDPKAARVVDAIIRGGGSLDEVNAYIGTLGQQTPVTQEQFDAAKKLLAKGYEGPLSSVTRAENNGAFNRLSASPVGAYGINAADAVSGGLIDNAIGLAGGDAEDARAKMQAVSDANPTASMLGGVTGAGLGAAGMEFGLGGLATRLPGIAGRVVGSARTADGLYGGIYGAGSNDQDPLTGALIGTGTGVLGGMFGRGLARGAGHVASGVRNQAVRTLNDLGVPMTVGQVLGQSGRFGNAVRTFENALSGIPVVGDVVKARQREGFQGLNQAAFNQGLDPIGATTNGTIGAEGVDAARNAVSNAYNNTLDPLSLARDAQFTAANDAARAAGTGLPDDMAGRATYAIDRAVQNFSPEDELSGRGFQQAIRRFRRATSQNAPLPNGDDLGDVMRQAEGAYNGLVERQAPDVLPAYQNANQANRNVSVIKDAVNRARNGTRTGETDLFSASQLSDAAAANARRFGGTEGTTQQPFFQLTRAAQQVLPSNVPDSGTAGRLATLALPTLLGGAGAGGGYALGDAGEGAKYGLGAGLLATLGGTRSAQRLMTRALLERPDWAERLSTELARRSPYVGMAFTGLGSSLTPALVPSR